MYIFVLNSTLDVLSNDTTHFSLRWKYRPATIERKKMFEYIVHSLKVGSEQLNFLELTTFLLFSVILLI